MELLDAREDEALYRRVYRTLREAVLRGELPSGARVPSSRDLARRWGVARNTVLEALDLLVTEGYLEARRASGTFVAPALPPDAAGAPAAASPPLRLSAWAERALAQGARRPGEDARAAPPPEIDFRVGAVPTDLFPSESWAQALAGRARELRRGGYGDELGPRETREALCAYLARERGVLATPQDLMLTSGSQGSLDALARALLDPGRIAVMEDPGYGAARRVFEASGARVVPVPVDDAGLRVDRLPPRADLVYVTPAHQFPTGALMRLERRLALLEWAARAGAWIIEDDYNSEFRFGSRPIAALQGLAPHTVVYVGTFSKSLAPALRSGYLVAPPALLGPLARVRAVTDRQPPTLDALALADFLAGGLYARHVRRAREVAEGRADTLLRALAEELPEWRPRDTGAGLHLCVDLPPGVGEEALRERAARASVGVSVLSEFAVRPTGAAVLLAFAHLPEERIREGVRRLSAAARGAG